MKTLLVPLDGSALAECVLPYAALLARKLDASLHLLHVISDAERDHVRLDEPAVWAEAGDAAARAWQRKQSLVCETLRQYAENYLEGHAERLRRSGLYVSVEADIGEAAATIAKVGARGKASLIAMATHGYSGLARWALGSVADTVLHAAASPVLLVRGDAPKPAASPALKRIVVPLDGSDLARQALPAAIELADAAKAELIVVRVITPSIEEYLSTSPPMVELRAALRDQALQAYAVGRNAARGGQLSVSTAVLVGHAAEAIAEEVNWRHADLIVMATHAYGVLKRWVRGSVADQLLHATTTPLLLVRGKAGQG